MPDKSATSTDIHKPWYRPNQQPLTYRHEVMCSSPAKAAVVISPPPSQEQHVPHWTDIDWDRSIANRLTSDLRVRYLDYGSGPALVLLHGMAASWQWWLENIPTLARHHRVIAVDLPGFGQSEPLPAPAQMATHARTVRDIESATVSGYSMGAGYFSR